MTVWSRSSEAQALRVLTRDGRLLFSTRMVRLFAYGFLSVVLALYLVELGFSDRQIGLLLTATLAGDAVISLGIASIADRVGRRRMLLVGAGLMIFAGLMFASTRHLILLTVAAILGPSAPVGMRWGRSSLSSRRRCHKLFRIDTARRFSPGTIWPGHFRLRSAH